MRCSIIKPGISYLRAFDCAGVDGLGASSAVSSLPFVVKKRDGETGYV